METMTDDQIRDAVRAALDNAVENGWEILAKHGAPATVTDDLLDLDADLEDCPRADVMRYVEEWQKEHM